MNVKFNHKYFIVLLGSLIILAIGIYYWLLPWKIDGVWVSGPNDSFGLMPIKKEFIIDFQKDSYKFKGNVRPVKRYQYDLENQMVIVHTDRGVIKVRILDKNTVRFNEGSKSVGLRVYRRID